MSDFLARKVKTYFKHLDFNNDGFISLNDFLEIPNRICDAEKASDDVREKVKACYVKLWRIWMRSAGSDDDSGLLTASIFVESVRQQRNDPEFKETYLTTCHHFFRVADVNGDGFLQKEEYARALSEAGIQDTSIMNRAFESIDLNKDGELSLEEFAIALLDYITSEDDEGRYANLWGPLVS